MHLPETEKSSATQIPVVAYKLTAVYGAGRQIELWSDETPAQARKRISAEIKASEKAKAAALKAEVGK